MELSGFSQISSSRTVIVGAHASHIEDKQTALSAERVCKRQEQRATQLLPCDFVAKRQVLLGIPTIHIFAKVYRTSHAIAIREDPRHQF